MCVCVCVCVRVIVSVCEKQSEGGKEGSMRGDREDRGWRECDGSLYCDPPSPPAPYPPKKKY